MRCVVGFYAELCHTAAASPRSQALEAFVHSVNSQSRGLKDVPKHKDRSS